MYQHITLKKKNIEQLPYENNWPKNVHYWLILIIEEQNECVRFCNLSKMTKCISYDNKYTASFHKTICAELFVI